jgi:mono/diheme cytochrome c family protein
LEVLEYALRGLSAPPMLARTLACAALLLGACSGAAESETLSDVERGQHYDESETFRRDALVASLQNPDNGYARLRLERYLPEQWEALPLWQPAIRVVSEADIGGAKPATGFAPLEIDAVPWAEAPLLELGRRAFYEYPVQLMASAALALSRSEAPSKYGLWNAEGRLGGLLWTALPGDAVSLAVTCSTCHATTVDQRLVSGKNNSNVDIGLLASDFRGDAPNLAWGAGRLDVTSDDSDNPVAIPDLRPIRYQQQLQRAATVKNDLIALAIRTETLIITSLGETARPPRKLAFALALFLWRLPDTPLRRPDEISARGERIFGQRCASCHQPPRYSGPAIALEQIGTDPSVGQSTERGTGAYRVPSLRHVGDRTPLFATGSVRDLPELLDPSRTATGHPYGLDLDSAQRADLMRFLDTL